MCISYTIIDNNSNPEKKIEVILISKDKARTRILGFRDLGGWKLSSNILKYNHMIISIQLIHNDNHTNESCKSLNPII